MAPAQLICVWGDLWCDCPYLHRDSAQNPAHAQISIVIAKLITAAMNEFLCPKVPPEYNKSIRNWEVKRNRQQMGWKFPGPSSSVECCSNCPSQYLFWTRLMTLVYLPLWHCEAEGCTWGSCSNLTIEWLQFTLATDGAALLNGNIRLI